VLKQNREYIVITRYGGTRGNSLLLTTVLKRKCETFCPSNWSRVDCCRRGGAADTEGKEEKGEQLRKENERMISFY